MDWGIFSFELVFQLRSDEVEARKCSPPVTVGDRPVYVRNVKPRGALPGVLLDGITGEKLEERGPPGTVVAPGVRHLRAALAEKSAQSWKSEMGLDADECLASFFRAHDQRAAEEGDSSTGAATQAAQVEATQEAEGAGAAASTASAVSKDAVSPVSPVPCVVSSLAAGLAVNRDEEIELPDSQTRAARYTCSYESPQQELVFHYIILRQDFDAMTMW
jgi:hypothetical protein